MKHVVRRASGAWLVALLGSGCSAAVGTSDVDATRDGAAEAASDATVREAGEPEVGPGEPVQCNGVSPGIFPSFDRRCTSARDCTVLEHQVDCCGNFAALGANASERARFEAAEGVCRAMYPGCGCAGGSYRADDGETRGEGLGAVVVECRSGVCSTSIRASEPCDGVTCAAGSVCLRPCCGTPGCSPGPGQCVRIPPACANNPSCSCFPTNPCPTGSCVGWEGGRPLCQCA